MKLMKKLIVTVMILLFSIKSASADRAAVSWQEFISSSDFIATAQLTKIESDISKGTIAYFDIDNVFKGDKLKSIKIKTGAIGCLSNGNIILNELGAYILFLKNPEITSIDSCSMVAEKFMKEEYLFTPEYKPLEVINEKSFYFIRGIPVELYSNAQIRLVSYGNTFDFKTKVIKSLDMKSWLRENISGK